MVAVLNLFLGSSVAAGDAGLIGGFFDRISHGIGDAFVEDWGNDVFGGEFVLAINTKSH